MSDGKPSFLAKRAFDELVKANKHNSELIDALKKISLGKQSLAAAELVEYMQCIARTALAPQPPASRSREGIDERAERIVTELFKDFRDWSRRGFGPEDVTWCEVKDRVMRLCSMAPLPSRDSAVEAGLAVWPSSESYDERIAVKEILDAAAPHLHAEWLERFLQDDSGLPSRFTDGEAK